MNSTTRSSLVIAVFLIVGIAVPATSAEDGRYTLRRLRTDRAFGVGGVVNSIASHGRHVDKLQHIEIDSQGRIVVAGESLTHGATAANDPVAAPAVARLLADGRLDPSFGIDGIVLPPFQGWTTGLAIDSQDRVAISGSFVDPADPDVRVVVCRFLDTGEPDSAFGANGVVRLPAGTAPRIWRFRADPHDDALVGLGRGTVVRFTADGVLDEAFGSGGTASVAYEAIGLAVDSQGRAIVSSEEETVRLLLDGSRDETIGAGGLLRGPHGGAMESHSVAIDGQQRIVMRGTEQGVGSGIYRFLSTGEPDATFGEGGTAWLPVAAPSNAEAPEIAIGVSRGETVRYAFSSTLHLYAPNLSRQLNAFGSLVQVVDPADPHRLASRVVRDRPVPDRSVQTFLDDVAVSDDGTRVYAAGGTTVQYLNGFWAAESPVVMCVDLSRSSRAPLPDLVAAWSEEPAVVRTADEFHLTGSVRVSNAGRGSSASVRVEILLSDDPLPSGDDQILDVTVARPLRPGQSRTVKVPPARQIGGPGPSTFGKYLIAVANFDDAPESDVSNDAVASAALTD